MPLRVIDAHTHLFPDEVQRDRRRHLRQDAWFGELYAPDSAVLVTPEQMIASMDEAGIERSIVCGWPWRDPGLCREHNDYLAEVAATFADRISWLAIVNPGQPGAAQEAERSLAMGACGVGELNADAQGFEWQLPGLGVDIADVLIARSLPLLMHCSEPVGHRYPGKGTATPEKLLSFISAHPDLRIVAAHWGGGLPFYELMPEIAAICRNVAYDTAASTYLYQWNVFPAVETMIGAGKIVLGTDYPLLKQRPFLSRVLRSGIGEAALPALLAGNAAAIFSLESREGET